MLALNERSGFNSSRTITSLDPVNAACSSVNKFTIQSCSHVDAKYYCRLFSICKANLGVNILP
jgi:hypothetical protein